jgi:hypothetical protein
MPLDLPEGITYNDNSNKFNEAEVDSTIDVVNDTKCNKCELRLRAELLTINNRHEGIIKTMPNENILWKNTLPKDPIRCIKLINETLMAKLEKHMERHKND